MKKTSSWLVTAACLALPLAATAQANSAGPATPPSALRYESAFADYKPWQDIQPGNWRAINDRLRAQPAGHGEQVTAPAAGPSALPQAKPDDGRQAPMPDHGAHHMPGGRP